MTARVALTARPPWALPIWVDEGNIFIEIAAAKTGMQPYVAKFPRSEGGLSKCLHVMFDHHLKAGRAKYTAPKPDVKRVVRRRVVFTPSPELEAQAADMIRKRMGAKVH